MAGRFARSLDLARAAWSVVRADKELCRYATDHATPLPGFGPELLEGAFATKQ